MRKLMWFALGFLCACVVGTYAFSSYSWGLVSVLLLFSIVLVGATHWMRWLRIFAVLLLSFSVGAGWFLAYDSVYLSYARELDSKTESCTIEVSDYPADTKYGEKVEGILKCNGMQYSVLVYLDEQAQCQLGDQLTGRFLFSFTADAQEDSVSYRRSEGIFLIATQKGEISVESSDALAFYQYPAKMRKDIANRLDSVFSSEAAGFAKALFLGDRSGVSYEMNTAFKLSGISHIIAVSGLHVSILFSFIYLLCGRKRVLVFLLGYPALILFAAITGFTPSVTRACIMQGLMLLAMLTEKEYDPPTALGFAVLIMTAANPMVVASISFQLSVGCMTGIFLFSDKIRNWLADRMGREKGKSITNRLKSWFAVSISVSLGASIVTTPLVAIHFGAVSLVSLLTNLLVVWIVSYVFYRIFLIAILGFISAGFAQVVAWLVTGPILAIIGWSTLLSKLPLSAVYTESPYTVIWLLGCYLMLIVFLCANKKPVLLYICTCMVTLCACLMAAWLEPSLDECRVTAINVGQGQSILLQAQGKNYLVDCGGSSDTQTSDTVAETLLSQGIYRLDGIVVTHYDLDHAGGVPYLLSRIEVDKVYLPAVIDDSGLLNKIRGMVPGDCTFVSGDMVFQLGQERMTIFGPENLNFGNESSLCVLFQSENCDILITGDRGTLGEALLMHRGDLPEVDVLVAGHHGSADSTGEALLAAVRPRYVMISVGKNSYGHPAPELLQRLSDYDCEILRTDQLGTIIFRG